MTESINWAGEQERRDAVAELTALRRELKTETAAGARAAAKDPRFIAAQQRLDAAKSNVGLRTSAQDLAALNKLDASRTPTGTTTRGEQVTAKATSRAERNVTKALNAPFTQYYDATFRNPNEKPMLRLREVTDAVRQRLQETYNAGNDEGFESVIENANYEWRWIEPGTAGNKKGYWGIIINTESVTTGPKVTKEEIETASAENAQDVASRMWRSGEYSAEEIGAFLDRVRPGMGGSGLGASVTNLLFDDLRKMFPNITTQEFQRLENRLKREGKWPKTLQEAEEFFMTNPSGNRIPDREKINALYKEIADLIAQERNK